MLVCLFQTTFFIVSFAATGVMIAEATCSTPKQGRLSTMWLQWGLCITDKKTLNDSTWAMMMTSSVWLSTL